MAAQLIKRRNQQAVELDFTALFRVRRLAAGQDGQRSEHLEDYKLTALRSDHRFGYDSRTVLRPLPHQLDTSMIVLKFQ